eukprot:m.117891 g.117891  ORF g.117891 m.117891 type:complete len:220 (-) comp10958_c0_seq5:567-1226(-)
MASSSKAQLKLDKKLYEAVKRNKVQLVHQYLRQGADPDAPVGKDNITAMNRAAKLKDRQVEIALLNCGGTLDPGSTLLAKKTRVAPRQDSVISSASNDEDDGQHWIANSHSAGSANPTQAADLDSGVVGPMQPRGSETTLITDTVSRKESFGGLSLPRGSQTVLRPVGEPKVFEGRWLYSKKVLERVSTMAVTKYVFAHLFAQLVGTLMMWFMLIRVLF